MADRLFPLEEFLDLRKPEQRGSSMIALSLRGLVRVMHPAQRPRAGRRADRLARSAAVGLDCFVVSSGQPDVCITEAHQVRANIPNRAILARPKDRSPTTAGSPCKRQLPFGSTPGSEGLASWVSRVRADRVHHGTVRDRTLVHKRTDPAEPGRKGELF